MRRRCLEDVEQVNQNRSVRKEGSKEDFGGGLIYSDEKELLYCVGVRKEY